MIIDKIENIALYVGLNNRIEKALKYIQHTDFETIASGRYDLDGDRVYALVNNYDTKAENESCLEAHQKYIDVQYMIEGEELIGYTAFNDQKATKAYDATNDYLLFEEKYSLISFKKGMFTIFFPEDLHMPGIKIDAPKRIKKVVVKVKI